MLGNTHFLQPVFIYASLLLALGGGLTQLLGLHTTYFLVAGAYACALAVIVAVLRMRGTRQGAAGLAGP